MKTQNAQHFARLERQPTGLANKSNVALCSDNIQIEGIANILGRINDNQNNEIIETYKKYYKSSYETYMHNETEVLIEIVLRKIVKWDYEDGKPYRIFIDTDNKQARKEMYPIKSIL
ncbi:MAG: hypothetical protein LBC53_06635 [Spirochaetaceae bacterium]|nr:hypothetical protein [Spirochaetaceae bacterium]